MKKTIHLQEVADGGVSKVDRDAGVLYGVRLLGPKSANNRRYLPEAISKAAHLYEGKQVNYDHSHDNRGRAVNDRAGWIRNVQESSGGLSGDCHLFLADARAQKILEAAEKNPAMFGFSHTAEGRGDHNDDGELIVREITKVISVDIVSDPATTRSLFESKEQMLMKKTLKETIEAVNPGGLAALREIVGDDIVPDSLPVSPDAGGDAESQISVALNAAAKAVIDDDSVDAKATAKKVGEIMAAKDKLMGKETKEQVPPAADTDEVAAEEEEEDDEKEKTTAESIAKLTNQVDKLLEQMRTIKGALNTQKPQGGQVIVNESRKNDMSLDEFKARLIQ